MFKKVLIAEDHDNCHWGIKKNALDLQIPISDQTFYCDDALLKIQKGVRDKNPYELLITDLSFDSDHRNQILTNGKELIEAARNIQPGIKVIIFSVENRPTVIQTLFKKYKINGFVSKGREDSIELKKAIQAAYEDKTYTSQNNKNSSYGNICELTQYDIKLLELLSDGFKQKQVENYFKEHDISPSSESSIEKRLSFLRESFDAKDTKQLLSIIIESGLI